MKKWKKIIINKSNRITKINKVKNFIDFGEDVEIGGYNSNKNYNNKKKFFDFYLKEMYLIWHNNLKNNLNPEIKTL